MCVHSLLLELDVPFTLNEQGTRSFCYSSSLSSLDPNPPSFLCHFFTFSSSLFLCMENMCVWTLAPELAPWVKSPLYPHDSASQRLSDLSCKMGLILVPNSQGCWKELMM